MARINLTAGKIRDFATDKAQAFKWDTEAPGLAIRATASGNKAFVFQAKLSGNAIRCTIGDVKAWGIDEARAEARRLQTLIDQGIDPRLHKQERIEAAQAKRAEARRRGATVAEAWAAYVADRSHKWSPRHLRDHNVIAQAGGVKRKRSKKETEAGPLASMMPLKLGELTPELVTRWLRREAEKRPTRTALAYRLLRAFIRWCVTVPEYQTANLEAVGSRPRDHLPKVKAKEDDCLQREQLALWFDAVRKLGNPVQSSYLQALILTGARREEMAGLTWDAVDFQWRSLTIGDKVEGERIIPLTPYLASLLAALPRRKDKRGKPVPWVFSSPTSATGHLTEPRAAHTRALKAAGLPHLSLHGLRRSFGTLAEWVEAPVGIVAQIMGHKPSAIAEKHYRRRPLDLLRLWHTRIEAWLIEQAGIPQPEENAEGLRLVASNSKKAIL